MKDQLMDFYLEHKKNIWLGAAIFVAAVVAVVMFTIERGEQKEIEGTSNVLVDQQLANIQEHFSELEVRNLGYTENYPAFEITLFLKKPFVGKDTFDNLLYEYVELLKYKYNDDKEHVYLSGVKFRVYDRIENYAEGTNPRSVATYQLLTVDDKDLLEEYKDMNFMDLVWQESLQPKKVPKYEEYVISSDFQPYNLENRSPYTSQEYELFRKILLYGELKGSLEGGIDMFLFWDFGIPKSTTELLPYNDLIDFMNYGRAYGESMSIYTGLLPELQSKLAVENPRLLAYSLTGEVHEEKLEAKRALVRYDREYYLPIYVQEAQEIVNELGAEEGMTYIEELEVLKDEQPGAETDVEDVTSDLDAME